jgi:predicted GIY-YIG superfamily endonuclease
VSLGSATQCKGEPPPRRSALSQIRQHNTSSDVAKAATPARRCLVSYNFIGSASGTGIATGVAVSKRFVYGLRSASNERRFYIGVTGDVRARIEWHNAGRCDHTAKHRPWELVVAVEFATEQRALAFERYLKSGSGRAFAKRHFG